MSLGYPIHLMAGDSLTFHGLPPFAVGEQMMFTSDQEVLRFLSTAVKREVAYVETDMPSILVLLFGGTVQSRIVRETRYFKPDPLSPGPLS